MIIPIRKILLPVLVVFLTDGAFCQEKKIYGIVSDKKTSEPILGVSVEILKTDRKVYTDSLGNYSIDFPRKHGNLLFFHDEYKPETISLSGPYRSKHLNLRLITIKVIQTDRLSADSSWKNKNVLSVLPYELIIGSLGLQYERYIKVQHSIGLHASFYLFGWGYSMKTQGDPLNKFTGFKISPFYRFYPKQTKDLGFFLEGKLILGYFDMHPLLYRYNTSDWFGINYIAHGENLNFWSGGASFSIGWAIRLPEFDKGLFNLSLGVQYLPLTAPDYINYHDDPYSWVKFHKNETWWYLGGPGSIILIKVAYGGIF